MVTRQPKARTTTRRYVSSRRTESAAQTRTAIVTSARRLFAERGWAATGVRDVARDAGVAVETVYANFGSKPDVLRAAFEAAIVGDDLPVPLAERPEFAELGRGTLAERARAAARLVRDVHERTRGLERALREAAAADTSLSTFLAEGDARRRVNVEQGVQLVTGRDVSETERDALWALLSMEVFQLLVDRSGWSPSRYEDWVADAIVRLVRPMKEEP